MGEDSKAFDEWNFVFQRNCLPSLWWSHGGFCRSVGIELHEKEKRWTFEVPIDIVAAVALLCGIALWLVPGWTLWADSHVDQHWQRHWHVIHRVNTEPVTGGGWLCASPWRKVARFWLEIWWQKDALRGCHWNCWKLMEIVVPTAVLGIHLNRKGSLLIPEANLKILKAKRHRFLTWKTLDR